jgi:hypothetical protein
MKDENGQAVIGAIRAWVARLPDGIAALTEEVDEWEHALTLTPLNPHSAWVAFRIAHNGSIGLYFGQAACFEEIAMSPEFATEICDAIRQGRVTDNVRVWRGRTVDARTVLHLSDKTLSDWMIRPIGFLPLGTNRRIQYQSWD